MENKFLRTSLFLTFFIFFAFSVAADQTLDDAHKAYRQKQYAKALAILESLPQTGQDDVTINLLLGHSAVKLEQWEKAVAAFEKVIQAEPDSLAGHWQLGFIYEKQKEPEKAKVSWQKVLSLAKDEKTKKIAQKHLDNIQ